MPPRIALFLKAPRPGFVKTRLAATVGDRDAVAIYRQLVERQVQALPQDWPATVHFDPPDALEEMSRWLLPLHPGLHFLPQSQGGLGERLTAAMTIEFSRQPVRVIAIGGDCPALDGAVFAAAHKALDTADVVIGPATDGGYYLIGMNRPYVDLFAGVAWSTPSVLAQTRSLILARNLLVHELSELEDVDDAASWHRVNLTGNRGSGVDA